MSFDEDTSTMSSRLRDSGEGGLENDARGRDGNGDMSQERLVLARMIGQPGFEFKAPPFNKKKFIPRNEILWGECKRRFDIFSLDSNSKINKIPNRARNCRDYVEWLQTYPVVDEEEILDLQSQYNRLKEQLSGEVQVQREDGNRPHRELLAKARGIPDCDFRGFCFEPAIRPTKKELVAECRRRWDIMPQPDSRPSGRTNRVGQPNSKWHVDALSGWLRDHAMHTEEEARKLKEAFKILAEARSKKKKQCDPKEVDKQQSEERAAKVVAVKVKDTQSWQQRCSEHVRGNRSSQSVVANVQMSQKECLADEGTVDGSVERIVFQVQEPHVGQVAHSQQIETPANHCMGESNLDDDTDNFAADINMPSTTLEELCEIFSKDMEIPNASHDPYQSIDGSGDTVTTSLASESDDSSLTLKEGQSTVYMPHSSSSGEITSTAQKNVRQPSELEGEQIASNTGMKEDCGREASVDERNSGHLSGTTYLQSPSDCEQSYRADLESIGGLSSINGRLSTSSSLNGDRSTLSSSSGLTAKSQELLRLRGGGNSSSTTKGNNDKSLLKDTFLLDKQGRGGKYTGRVIPVSRLFRRQVPVPHGKGTMVYDSKGLRYEGEWFKGAWHGYGRLEYGEGGFYAGIFVNGQFCGHGTRGWPDGSEHDGGWKGNKRSGKGTQRNSKGDVLEGNWVNDKLVGPAVLRLADPGGLQNGEECNHLANMRESVFEGEWVSDKALGDGTYDGFWKDGRPHGYGKCRYGNGDSYEGCYVKGKKQGPGTYVGKGDNGRYVGEWERDQMHGYGEWDHSNGTCHKGEYRNGWPHGEGRSVKRNGDEEYIGTFVKGKMEGKGWWVDSNGCVYEGNWHKGKRDGNGHWKCPNGDEYKGGFRKGLKHGQGCYTRADGSVRHDGLWRKDEPVDVHSPSNHKKNEKE